MDLTLWTDTDQNIDSCIEYILIKHGTYVAHIERMDATESQGQKDHIPHVTFAMDKLLI